MRVLPILLLLAVVFSGCLGGESRSEWAYDVTQLDDTYGDGHRGSGVIIAILDTGINLNHPAMEHLDDGDKDNGEVIAFKDFLDGASGVDAAFDDDGHGTHVAGIISARGSNFGDKLVNGGVDLRGAAPNAQLVIARVCGNDSCDPAVIDDALRWAVNEKKAQVVGLSLGGQRGESIFDLFVNTDPIDQAINSAIDRGVVVVAAAGNDGPDNEDVSYPSSIPGVIAVGAINDKHNVATFSNRGDSSENRGQNCGSPILESGRCSPNQKPEVVAPGTEIISAWTGSNYVRASGTSQATPFVTSVVAILLEDQPKLDSRSDVEQIKQVLKDTARRVSGQATPHDPGAGYGIVQASAALQAYQG